MGGPLPELDVSTVGPLDGLKILGHALDEDEPRRRWLARDCGLIGAVYPLLFKAPTAAGIDRAISIVGPYAMGAFDFDSSPLEREIQLKLRMVSPRANSLSGPESLIMMAAVIDTSTDWNWKGGISAHPREPLREGRGWEMMARSRGAFPDASLTHLKPWVELGTRANWQKLAWSALLLRYARDRCAHGKASVMTLIPTGPLGDFAALETLPPLPPTNPFVLHHLDDAADPKRDHFWQQFAKDAKRILGSIGCVVTETQLEDAVRAAVQNPLQMAHAQGIMRAAIALRILDHAADPALRSMRADTVRRLGFDDPRDLRTWPLSRAP